MKLLNVEDAPPARAAVPVVKAKATSLMSSIMISKSTEHLILIVYTSACDTDVSELLHECYLGF